jgi:hypothetical protein
MTTARAEAEEAWKAVLRKRGVFVSPNTPLGDAVLEARDAALLAERRRAIEEAAQLYDAVVLEHASVFREGDFRNGVISGAGNYRQRIRALASPREETPG